MTQPQLVLDVVQHLPYELLKKVKMQAVSFGDAQLTQSVVIYKIFNNLDCFIMFVSKLPVDKDSVKPYQSL